MSDPNLPQRHHAACSRYQADNKISHKRMWIPGDSQSGLKSDDSAAGLAPAGSDSPHSRPRGLQAAPAGQLQQAQQHQLQGCSSRGAGGGGGGGSGDDGGQKRELGEAEEDELDQLLDQYSAQAAAETRKLVQKMHKRPGGPKSMAQLRDQGLSKPLSSDNKGFKLLQKMGYQAGQGLGASQVGRSEPLEVSVRSNRSGLGVDEQRKRAREEQQRAEREKQVKHAAHQQASAQLYMSHQRGTFQQRKLSRQLHEAWRACQQLEQAALEQPQAQTDSQHQQQQQQHQQQPQQQPQKHEHHYHHPPQASVSTIEGAQQHGTSCAALLAEAAAGTPQGSREAPCSNRLHRAQRLTELLAMLPDLWPSLEISLLEKLWHLQQMQGSGRDLDDLGTDPSHHPIGLAQGQGPEEDGGRGCREDAGRPGGSFSRSSEVLEQLVDPDVPLEQQLQLLLDFLRREHCYCLYCGCVFNGPEDMAAACPGPGEDDH